MLHKPAIRGEGTSQQKYSWMEQNKCKSVDNMFAIRINYCIYKNPLILVEEAIRAEYIKYYEKSFWSLCTLFCR